MQRRDKSRSQEHASRRAGVFEAEEFREPGHGLRHSAATSKDLEARLARINGLVALGTLAAGVGHEINNPLTYLMSSLDLAAGVIPRVGESSHATLARLRVQLEAAREAAERIRGITDDLRGLARRDQGPCLPTDVREVLDSCVRVAQHKLRLHARVVRQYDDVPLVQASSGRLGQVFLNLLVNAAEAIPAGRPEANSIVLRTSLEPSGAVCVEIRDTGIGIAARNRSRIFDEFFTTKTATEGTGLGLAICKRILTGLGGSIDVDSVVGGEAHGTKFRVTLPPASRQAPSVRDAKAVQAARVASRSLSILVVDDELRLGTSITSVLTGHRVSTAVTARAALALCQYQRFDLILCDVVMPGLTGRDFHDALARLHPGAEAAIVFMTAAGFVPGVKRMIDGLPNRVLDKPFLLDELLLVVDERARELERDLESVAQQPAPAATVDVLLVEDNPGDVGLVDRALRRAAVPCQLHAVNDGAKALAFLRHERDYAAAPRPSCVLLDLSLPGKSGLEVLAAIKRESGLRDIPVIVLSSSRSEQDIAKAYQLQAAAYMAKPPSDYAEIMSTILRFIRAAEPPPAPRAVGPEVCEHAC